DKIIIEIKKNKLDNSNDFTTVFSESNYLEVLPVGTSKGRGVNRLLSSLDKKDLYYIGIGDNLNDISLLENVDLGIAIKNEQQEVKQEASKISEQTNEE